MFVLFSIVAFADPLAGCNSHGCWTNGGGCNSHGCWNSPVGSCNSHGCSDHGECNSHGCPPAPRRRPRFDRPDPVGSGGPGAPVELPVPADTPVGSCNSYGCWTNGGGCNSYGCWNSSIGACNSHGCSDWGECNSYGCPLAPTWSPFRVTEPPGSCNSHGCWANGGGCNSHGCWAHGGGCNSYGCWNSPVGACNSYGCSDRGECNSYGCP